MDGDQKILSPIRKGELRVLFSITAIVFLFGWLLFGVYIQDWLQREQFDPVAWKGDSDANFGIRLRMVDDLLRRHDFHGMTRKQVADVIGEPDQTEFSADFYELGPERGHLSLDSEWLVLRFDDDGKVTDCRY